MVKLLLAAACCCLLHVVCEAMPSLQKNKNLSSILSLCFFFLFSPWFIKSLKGCCTFLFCFFSQAAAALTPAPLVMLPAHDWYFAVLLEISEGRSFLKWGWDVIYNSHFLLDLHKKWGKKRKSISPSPSSCCFSYFHLYLSESEYFKK